MFMRINPPWNHHLYRWNPINYIPLWDYNPPIPIKLAFLTPSTIPNWGTTFYMESHLHPHFPNTSVLEYKYIYIYIIYYYIYSHYSSIIHPFIHYNHQNPFCSTYPLLISLTISIVHIHYNNVFISMIIYNDIPRLGDFDSRKKTWCFLYVSDLLPSLICQRT